MEVETPTDRSRESLRQRLQREIDSIAQSEDAQRLARAIELGEGFHLAVVLAYPNASAALQVWLEGRLDATGDAQQLRLSPTPLDPASPGQPFDAADLVAAVFDGLLDGATMGGRVVVIDASRANDETKPGWLELFRRLNERRNVLTQEFAQSLVFILPPSLEGEFARIALDLWSVRSFVIRVPDLVSVAESEVLSRSMDWGYGRDEDPDSFETELEQARSHARRGSSAARRALRKLLLRRSGGYLRRGNLSASEAALDEAEHYAGEGDPARAAIEVARAQLLSLRGKLDEADARLVRALDLSRGEAESWFRADTWGYRAGIQRRRGQLDEALRIHREEELPVYQRLGDVRSTAIAMGKIADLLELRGELEEALRIRREEQLPVYRSLGDVHSIANTMGKVADILERRGQVDEALRIRREEELPVYQRLGDVRSTAIAMGRVADTLQRRGKVDEALRIRREEQLPVYRRLGDIQSTAIAMGKVAGILEQRGEPGEALRIRREEVLPILERLGDTLSIAFCKANIASLLLRSGQDAVEATKLLVEARDALRTVKLREADQIERFAVGLGIDLG